MAEKMFRFLILFTGLLVVASFAHAGGVDPRDMPASEPVKREKVTATPAQTSAAVSKARRVVAPEVKEEQVRAPQPKAIPQPKAVPKVSRDSWLLSSGGGKCAPLSDVSRTVKNIGNFKTPQEFARQMQQRGYHAFVLDIGDAPEQLIRVKVPDQDLDLTFLRAGLCR